MEARLDTGAVFDATPPGQPLQLYAGAAALHLADERQAQLQEELQVGVPQKGGGGGLGAS